MKSKRKRIAGDFHFFQIALVYLMSFSRQISLNQPQTTKLNTIQLNSTTINQRMIENESESSKYDHLKLTAGLFIHFLFF